jgi:hypothetical protein
MKRLRNFGTHVIDFLGPVAHITRALRNLGAMPNAN